MRFNGSFLLFPIDIDNSINSGQVFLWEKDGTDWYGINGQNILKINKNGTIKAIINSQLNGMDYIEFGFFGTTANVIDEELVSEASKPANVVFNSFSLSSISGTIEASRDCCMGLSIVNPCRRDK